MSKVFIQNESGNILAKDDEPYMIDQVGTDVFVNGVRQDRLDFASDPQEQITANKLSDAQMQAIGEIDAIKGIALQNQSDVTDLSASVLANTQRLNKLNTYGLIESNFSYTIPPNSFVIVMIQSKDLYSNGTPLQLTKFKPTIIINRSNSLYYDGKIIRDNSTITSTDNPYGIIYKFLQ